MVNMTIGLDDKTIMINIMRLIIDRNNDLFKNNMINTISYIISSQLNLISKERGGGRTKDIYFFNFSYCKIITDNLLINVKKICIRYNKHIYIYISILRELLKHI